MNVTILQQPPLRLITRKSRSFPAGNRDAFNEIETRLETLKGRKFYALIYGSSEQMDYFAGVVPESTEEEHRFVDEGFEVADVESGSWARVKLKDWESKTDQIGPTIAAVIAEYGYDSTRPQIEFYRSMNELHLLVPIPSSTSPAGGEQVHAADTSPAP